MISYLLQEHLKKREANFKEINDLQFILTKKGTKMQEEQFKRKCDKKKIELLQKGFNVNNEILKDYLLEEEANKLDEKIGYIINYDQI